MKCGARCCVTRSDGEGKPARRGAREDALTCTLGFTIEPNSVHDRGGEGVPKKQTKGTSMYLTCVKWGLNKSENFADVI